MSCFLASVGLCWGLLYVCILLLDPEWVASLPLYPKLLRAPGPGLHHVEFPPWGRIAYEDKGQKWVARTLIFGALER